MKILQIALIGACLVSSWCAAEKASCTSAIDTRAAAAIGREEATALRVDCKPMPSAPGKSIVALAYMAGPRPTEPGPEGEGVVDPDVLIVDSADGRILSRLHQDRAIADDIFRFDSFRIDTANYRLAPGVRA